MHYEGCQLAPQATATIQEGLYTYGQLATPSLAICTAVGRVHERRVHMLLNLPWDIRMPRRRKPSTMRQTTDDHTPLQLLETSRYPGNFMSPGESDMEYCCTCTSGNKPVGVEPRI